MKTIYLIGSLRNPKVPSIGKRLRRLGFYVFDDWFAAGPVADDSWQQYEKQKGHTYPEGLNGLAAEHVYEFDRKHINNANIGILYLPAGKSGHLELGYMIGQGKKCYILFDEEPDRWDVMYKFTDGVFFNFEDLAKELEK
ncbi:hypothetical protein IID19_01660 [Patescibacteria group bacterium]|nr:hypothetical protein [Patescibacteria group bacterium]